MKPPENNGSFLVLPLLGLTFACGAASVEPLEENDQDDFDNVEGDPDEAMEEPAALRSFGSQEPDDRQSGSPEAVCGLDSPLPAEVDGSLGADQLHTAGQQYILAKKGPSALAVLLLAEKKAPDNPAILSDLAVALLQCRLNDEAVARGERAVALAPSEVDIVANLAQIYQIVGRLNDAIERYRSALVIDENDHAALNNLAVLLVAQKNYKEAEGAARQAVRLSPNNPGYLVNLGYVLYRQKRFVDAEMIIRRALDIDPDDANAHNQMGVVLAAQRRDDRAKEEFRRALECNPNHRAAKENLKAIDIQPFLFDTMEE